MWIRKAWKYFILFCGVFALSVYVSARYHEHSQNAPNEASTPPNRIVSQTLRNSQTGQSAQQSSWRAPGWYGFFVWPQGITVWALFLTLLAIAEQSQYSAQAAEAALKTAQTAERAADAALLSAQAIIDNERGWIQVICKAILPQASQIPVGASYVLFPTVTNQGKTVCHITQMFITKRVVPNDSSLPPRPDFADDVGSSSLLEKLLCVPQSPLTPLGIPISREEIIQARQTRAQLFIYGFVAYEIAGKKGETSRFTRFIFRWHNYHSTSAMPEGFLMPTGCHEYSSAT